MNLASTQTATPAVALVGALLLGLLVGCSELPKSPVGTKPENNQLSKLFLEPHRAVGALVIGKNGEIRPVDVDGNPLKPCRLPDVAGVVQDGLDLPECSKVRDITIRDIRSLADVTSSGPVCITYGGGLVGGKKMPTYQICYP